MPKRGWYAMNDGSYYLTLDAVCKEFKMTREKLVQFLNSRHGRSVDNFLLYPQVRTTKCVQVYSLQDLKKVLS